VANERGHLVKQPGARTVNTGTVAGVADILTGKAAAHDIDSGEG
jgi:hypothetical protein